MMRFNLERLANAFGPVVAQSSPPGVLSVAQFSSGCRALFAKMDANDIIALSATFNTSGLGKIVYENFADVMTQGLATNASRTRHFEDMRRCGGGSGFGPGAAGDAPPLVDRASASRAGTDAAAAAPHGASVGALGAAQLTVRFALTERAAYDSVCAVVADPTVGGAVEFFSSFAHADPASRNTLVWTVCATSATLERVLPNFFGDSRLARALAPRAAGGALGAVEVSVIGDVGAASRALLERVCAPVGARATFCQPLHSCLIGQ
jgi:hypothetical protein